MKVQEMGDDYLGLIIQQSEGKFWNQMVLMVASHTQIHKIIEFVVWEVV